MIKTVQNFLEKYKLSDKTLIVAFSGGADSLCLLDIIVKFKKNNVVAIHLNHNWRGEEAKSEQLRCQSIAENYGIKFFTETLEKQTKISENEARNLRYKFFEKCAKIFNGVVLTAHNSNDNAETIIYRIAKGTGISGLKGIPEFIEKNDTKFYRPLLKLSREKIENYCKENNLVPNQDSSNNSLKYKRNFIRHKIVPLLTEINPEVQKAINSLSEIATEQENIIENLINKYFVDKKISYPKFKNSEQNIKLKLIHKFCILNDLDYDRKKIVEISDFLNNPKNIQKTFSLTTNLWLTFDEQYIKTISYTKKNTDITVINGFGNFETFLGGNIEVFETNIIDSYPKECETKIIANLENIEFPLELRTRRDGDIIQPFGMTGSMKLKKYFINKKIPKEQRDKILLLTKGNEVLWVIGIGMSNKLKVANLPACVFKYK